MGLYLERKAHFIVMGMLLLFFVGCGSASSQTTSESGSGTSDGATAEAVGGNISALTVGNDSSTLALDDLEADDEIVLLIYSYNSSGNSAAYDLSGSTSSQYITDDDSLLEAASQNDLMEDENSVTEEFHGFLREQEEQLDSQALLADGEATQSQYLSQNLTVGDSRTFKVLNSFSSSTSYDTVTATLRYETDNFLFYVDQRNSSSLTDEDIQEQADYFEEIIPLERELFGTESDIDGNGKSVVLFTQTVNEIGGSSGGIVTGFFYAADLYSSSQYAISNEMEIFYTFVPDPTGSFGAALSKSFATINIYPGVLPHEFQHMINYNMHTSNGGSVESGWLNEALSHLAEDIHSADGNDYMTATSLENPARVDSYLDNVDGICFTCGTSLSQRGGSYLFIRYLYEQAEKGNLGGVTDGATLIGRLLDTSKRGVDNVVYSVLGTTGSDADFENLLGLFGLAVYLSDTGQTGDDRFNFDGINLRSVQDDNRGTVLNGPSVQSPSTLPFTDSLSGTGLSFVQLSGSTILDNGGSLSLSFGSSSDFGGYVIRN